MRNKIVLMLIAGFAMIFIISACKTGDKFDSRDPEVVFKKAMELYNEEEYLEAQNLFELIRLQFSATQYADDAQFYIGEIATKREEFVMAAYAYNQLRRIYPGSEYAKISLFNTAMSYYSLSPKFDRDQDYTRKAIQSFQEFQYIYPEDSLYNVSGNYITELRNKLAYREFFTAELYRKLDSPNSALVYYNSVINDFNDSEYYEDAFVGKIEVLQEMERFDEARGTIDVYKKLFPNGKRKDTVSELQKKSK